MAIGSSLIRATCAAILSSTACTLIVGDPEIVRDRQGAAGNAGAAESAAGGEGGSGGSAAPSIVGTAGVSGGSGSAGGTAAGSSGTLASAGSSANGGRQNGAGGTTWLGTSGGVAAGGNSASGGAPTTAGAGAGNGGGSATMGGTAGTAGASSSTGGCDLSKPYGVPFQVTAFGFETGISVSADGLTAVVSIDNKLKQIRRTASNTNFTVIEELLGVANLDRESFTEVYPRLSRDGLNLFYTSFLQGSGGLRVSSRATKGSEFGPGTDLTFPITDSGIDACAWVSPDNSTLYWQRRNVAGEFSIYRASVSGGTYADVARVADWATGVMRPALTSDELTLYFDSTRADFTSSNGASSGPNLIWKSVRTSKLSTWPRPTQLAEFGIQSVADAGYFMADVSPDGCTIYFQREDHIFQANKSR